jgi:nicotinic acid mononucleotide adenylyltransferase
MVLSRNPFDQSTRDYLHEALSSLPPQGPSLIKIVKQATEGTGYAGRVLGVFPASFNPPTSAHEALIKEAVKAVAMDELLLVLDQQAMDKELCGAPFEDRLLMLLALLGDDPHISLGVSNRGLFLEKVEALHKIYPPTTQIYFIAGYDTMMRVLDPTYYEDTDNALRSLFSQARFLVANREGSSEQALRKILDREENRTFAARVVPLTLPPALAWVSSSEVRQHVAEGMSVKGLVSPVIEEFVQKRGFYGRQG